MITPFIMLMVDGASLFLYECDFWQRVSLWYLNQISGHTLLTSFFMWYYATLHKFCLYSKISIIGLGLLNVYNIAHDVFLLSDYIVYSRIIVLTSLILAIVFLIKKWK
jgi:uncharacterized membrane protein YbjE (DUF340 family)